MAKGKHATALFEVMNKSRYSGNGRGGEPAGSSGGGGGGGGLPTPKWWFKSRNAGGGNEVRTIAPGAAAPVEPAVVEEPVAPVTVVEEPVVRAAAAAAPAMMPPLASSIDVPPAGMASPTPRVQPVAVSLDPDKQQISLRLSYTSALIGGFSVFIALGLAVLIGKSLSRGPSTAIANTSTQVLRQRPPTPGVMNVSGRRVVDRNNNGIDDAAESANSRGGAVTSTGTHNPQQPSFNDPRPPATFFTDDPHRSSGLNYAIIQGYPGKEREMAEQAAAFLTKNGVPCTVEQNLPNWRTVWPDGYMVVGIRGFAKTLNNPALEAYKKQIMTLSAKYTGGRSGFKAFSPAMYSWKKSN